MSKTILLNQNWIFSKEGHDEPVTLPHTWNAIDGQDGGNDYYRGTCSYTRILEKPELSDGDRAVLQFDGVAMTAVVSLNGEKVAEHKGGYSTFRVDITDALHDGANELIVSVDNSDNDTVYPQKADFTFYGGIYRDVTLHIVPAAHFALAENGAVPVKVTPAVTDLAERRCEVTVEAFVVGAQSVNFTLDGQQTIAAVKDGTARAVFTLEHARLWDGLDDPYLYTVTARLDNGETETARFGCRKFEIDPQKGFILNGHPYPLRGVSRHQDRKGAGVAITKEMMEEDMALILEMGANTIRLAHYQHAQAFYDLCDEKGVVIWAEIPYITMHMTNGRANTLTQMEELIVQNYNHPCIAVWGLSNEITAASAVNEELLENHRALNELAHRLIQHFGTLDAVFQAPPEALMQVSGIGENAAVLLNLVPAAQRCARRSVSAERILNSVERCGAYFMDLLDGQRRELLYQVCLDGKGKVLSCKCLSQGSADMTSLSIRQVVENALLSGAAGVVLGHNHPSGVALPSAEDRAATLQVRDALATMDIRLLDHIIVADGDFVSMEASGLLYG